MDTAFETETKKMVKAWVIGTNSSYIMPENDIFIANKNEIINYEETLKKHKKEFIECRFKKSHIRHYENGNKTIVIPHFFIPNKTKLGIETLPESPEHKKIKSFMYETFFSNVDLKLTYSKYKKKDEIINNNIYFKDLNIIWEDFSIRKEDFFEVGITDTFNTRRVDLFLKFKEFSPLFGEGLVIEVQLSPQSTEKQKERTIDRALKGYSCIWINKNHFEDIKEDNLKLKKEINIESWQTILHNNADNISQEIYNKIQKYSRLIDFKCMNTLKKIDKTIYLNAGMLCPKCKVGQLVLKKGNFLGCSEWKLDKTGCNQTYNVTKSEGVEDEE